MEILCPGKPADQVYGIIKTKLLSYRDQGKLQIKDVRPDDARKYLEAGGTGFTAKIQCSDGKVLVDLELGFLLKAIRGKIEDGIRENFSRALS